jgi:hypothetical protein
MTTFSVQPYEISQAERLAVLKNDRQSSSDRGDTYLSRATATMSDELSRFAHLARGQQQVVGAGSAKEAVRVALDCRQRSLMCRLRQPLQARGKKRRTSVYHRRMRDSGASPAGHSGRGPVIEDRQDALIQRYCGQRKRSMRRLIEFRRTSFTIAAFKFLVPQCRV